MKIHLLVATLTIATAVGSAQDRMAENLRKGVVEEETKHNLNAAIQDYQAALSQFAEARQTAATALFRIAECYRKEGKDDQAINAYKRVTQEFGDQGKLAEQSRSILTGTYHAPASEPASDAVQAARAREAREAYRQSLVEQVAMTEKDVQQAENLNRRGLLPAQDLDHVKMELLLAQRQLLAFDAGIPQAAATR